MTLVLCLFLGTVVIRDTSFNRDLEKGNLRWWNTYGQAGTTIVSPGYGSHVPLLLPTGSNFRLVW